MTVGTCAVPGCSSTETRRYTTGPACASHSPWGHAGRPDPTTLIDPARTDAALRITSASPWVMGGTDVDKLKPGGYVSKYRAEKIAAERDATSTLQHPERAAS